MKRNFFLILSLSAIFLSCTDNSYKITGHVVGAEEGDTVFMQRMIKRKMVKVDSTTITNGTFTFEGQQDSTVNMYINCPKGGDKYMTDFFLENGNINIELSANSKISGTMSNNTYQVFKEQYFQKYEEEKSLYNSLQDNLLSDEARAEKMANINTVEEEMENLIYQTIVDNINNPVGIHLLTLYAPMFEFEKMETLLSIVPDKYQNNERVVKFNQVVESEKSVAIGKKFIDLEMQTPNGTTIKLSDFISKNKYTLIDFWASWCGPCRKEMPILVEEYKKYKSEGLEIVGVSLDQDLNAWKAGIEALSITWPQMSDLKAWESKGAALYAVRSIPATVLINQEGVIIAKNLRGETLSAKLNELFN